MLQSIVSVDEFRTNLAELIGRVMYGKDQIIIKKYNRDAAVLINVEDYEKLLDPTKRLSSARWKDKFKIIDKIRASMPEIDPNVLEKEIDRTVKEVRAEKRAGAKNA